MSSLIDCFKAWMDSSRFCNELHKVSRCSSLTSTPLFLFLLFSSLVLSLQHVGENLGHLYNLPQIPSVIPHIYCVLNVLILFLRSWQLTMWYLYYIWQWLATHHSWKTQRKHISAQNFYLETWESSAKDKWHQINKTVHSIY